MKKKILDRPIVSLLMYFSLLFAAFVVALFILKIMGVLSTTVIGTIVAYIFGAFFDFFPAFIVIVIFLVGWEKYK